MFETSIHWTTFFYLLIDLIIVMIVFIRSLVLKSYNFNRFLILGMLFILYNATGGFLPLRDFTNLLIVQYIISYSVAIILCIYIIYFMYKEYNIRINNFFFKIQNISILITLLFITLFIIPYIITNSIAVARFSFIIPIALISFHFFWTFYNKIKESKETSKFLTRRNKLSIISVSAVILLPVLTVIGDYQWLTFTIMNLSFYIILAIEIDSYLYSLKNKYNALIFQKQDEHKFKESKLIHYDLTPREIDISVSILEEKTYKTIGNDFFIAERTVSKHASNIFKKTGATNRREFFQKFRKNSI